MPDRIPNHADLASWAVCQGELRRAYGQMQDANPPLYSPASEDRELKLLMVAMIIKLSPNKRSATVCFLASGTFIAERKYNATKQENHTAYLGKDKRWIVLSEAVPS